MIFVTHIKFPQGTPFRTRVRILRGAWKFARAYNKATPEKREQVFTYLDAKDGVTVTREEFDN
jgi:hypothetical protein